MELSSGCLWEHMQCEPPTLCCCLGWGVGCVHCDSAELAVLWAPSLLLWTRVPMLQIHLIGSVFKCMCFAFAMGIIQTTQFSKGSFPLPSVWLHPSTCVASSNLVFSSMFWDKLNGALQVPWAESGGTALVAVSLVAQDPLQSQCLLLLPYYPDGVTEHLM